MSQGKMLIYVKTRKILLFQLKKRNIFASWEFFYDINSLTKRDSFGKK